MHKYRNYSVFLEATYSEQKSNKVNGFPVTCRIPLLTDATRLTTSLENLTHELTLQPTWHLSKYCSSKIAKPHSSYVN